MSQTKCTGSRTN